MNEAPNPRQQIHDALSILRVLPEQVTELRVPNTPTRYGAVTSAGYFDDLDKLADAAEKLDKAGAPAVYITLNAVNPALLCRACNRVVERPKSTTADRDILRRLWLPVDVDPVRPADVSSSAAELDEARRRAADVESWLREAHGFTPTIRACSGNGWHVLYRMDELNVDAVTAEVKALIEAVSERFSDETVKVDTSVFNAARIWKLYGTMARKGDSVPKLTRVHRRACRVDSFINGVRL